MHSRKGAQHWSAECSISIVCGPDKDGTTKEFKYVEFSNGYRKNRPQFKVEFKGVEVIDEVNEVYSNGFRVNYPYKKEGYYKIILGSIIV